MQKARSPFWMMLPVIVLLTSCSVSGSSQGTAQPDYKSIKSMVIDILQTDEAKKAVAKMMKDEKFQESVVLDHDTVRTTLIQSIANPNNPQMKEAFRDPKFASVLAKTMKDEHKKVIKDLMKDPEYQRMLITVMRDPEFERNLLALMKSSAYRQQTKQIMMETLQSPIFQEQLMTLMTRATEEMLKPKSKGKKGNGGGGSAGGGG
ncbi:spore gernimation protein [Brevibacillus sp. SYP-B805]|uniref:spore germination lipoprotein GerD n=1 Tax=Brevibacillus sp. SYP-B805 TaxID=1578199 RepID=UPI0013ECC4DF|nr:spore germination lipoprotein GerD [Brevibacillus sp. SYP-B805]NGQ97222.1 spore gernimation protein [Brevibacillus sp. SYP-B805]